MDYDELRLECLRLANTSLHNEQHGMIVEAAEAFVAFVVGRKAWPVTAASPKAENTHG